MGTEGHSMSRVSSGDAFSSSYLRIRGYTALSSASNSSTSSACAEREFLPGSAQEETCIADRCEHSSHGIFKRLSATFAVKSCLWVALSHTAGYGCSTSAGGAMSTLSNWTMNVGESQTAEVPPGSSSMNWSREISAAITLAPAEVAPQPTGRGARPATASLEDVKCWSCWKNLALKVNARRARPDDARDLCWIGRGGTDAATRKPAGGAHPWAGWDFLSS